jgi:hypothetical protein
VALVSQSTTRLCPTKYVVGAELTNKYYYLYILSFYVHYTVSREHVVIIRFETLEANGRGKGRAG